MRSIVVPVEVLTGDGPVPSPQQWSTFRGRLRGTFLVFPRTLALEPGVGGRRG